MVLLSRPHEVPVSLPPSLARAVMISLFHTQLPKVALNFSHNFRKHQYLLFLTKGSWLIHWCLYVFLKYLFMLPNHVKWSTTVCIFIIIFRMYVFWDPELQREGGKESGWEKERENESPASLSRSPQWLWLSLAAAHSEGLHSGLLHEWKRFRHLCHLLLDHD